MKRQGLIKIGVWLGLCLCSLSLYSQTELDSVLQSTTNKIFDNPDEAIEIATDIYGKASWPSTKVSALKLISNAYLSKRENSKSLEYAVRMQQYLPELKNPAARMTILNTIGMQHQQLRIYDKAIEYLDEALQMAQQVKNPDSLPPILGYNYSIRGFIYREQMNCDIALNYFNKAIYQFKKIRHKETIKANLSTISYNKGNCFLQIAQIDSARTNFNTSIEYAETIGANSLSAFAKKGLSEVLTAEGQYYAAIEKLKAGEDVSEEVGDLILNQGIYKNLSDNYLAIDNREQYNIYFKKYTEVQNQIGQKEKETIDTTINDLIEENKISTETTLKKLEMLHWSLIGAIAILILVLGKHAIIQYRKFKIAKSKLESLKP